MQKTEIQVGRFGSLVLLAIWLVGLIEIVKWVIQGLT
jgi:hypothetical protein